MPQRKAQKSIQFMTIQIQDRRGADSRHYWNRTEITVFVCVCVCVCMWKKKFFSDMVLMPAQELSDVL